MKVLAMSEICTDMRYFEVIPIPRELPKTRVCAARA